MERSWDGHWNLGEPELAEAFIEFASADAVAIADSCGLELVAAPEPLRSDENRVFRLDVADGPVALKVYRHGRAPDRAIEEQLEFVDALASSGASVARGRRLADGSFLGRVAGQQFSLFEWWGDGDDCDLSDADARAGIDFERLGVGLARLHSLSVDRPLEHQQSYLPQTWGRAALDYLLANDVVHREHRDAFTLAAQGLLDRAEAVWPDEPLVAIHADLGHWNVVWPREGPPRMIDFEDLGLGLAWHDLSLLPHSFVNSELCGAAEAALIGDRLRSGYASVRPLPAGDAELGALIEGMRGLYIDCWIAARRQDRHFSLRRLSFHTKRYWESRVARIERYRSIR